ncbi:MAG: acyl-CoA dehydrogenase family protein [Aquihabitans sp.]
MSSAAAITHPQTRPLLDGVEEHFAARATKIDTGGQSTREALRFLGTRDLLDIGVGRDGPGTLGDMVDVITTVARSCMSSAFSAWAQRMTLEYVAAAGPGFAADGLLDGLASGQLAGSTAMASAFQDSAGLAPIPVTFTRRGDDLILDGIVPWASNLFADDGFWVTLTARGEDGQRVVVALPSTAPGLTVGPSLELLALGATASASLQLQGVAVPPELVVAHDVSPFLDAVRRPFLCLQAAFCVGLAEASALAVNARPDAGYGQFDSERLALALDLADVATRLHELAAGTGSAGDDPALSDRRQLLSMRLDAARLASVAVQLEVKVTGGAAYLARSDTARRLREAAFLPIQSPTEAHLRWELAACS